MRYSHSKSEHHHNSSCYYGDNSEFGQIYKQKGENHQAWAVQKRFRKKVKIIEERVVSLKKEE